MRRSESASTCYPEIVSARRSIDPDPTTVGQAIGTLISNAVQSGYQGGSAVLFTQKQTYSLEQAALSLGLSARYMGVSVKNKLDLSSVQQRNTLMAYFKQLHVRNLYRPPADSLGDVL